MKAECLFFTARRAAWSGRRTHPQNRSWEGSPDSHLVEAMGVEQLNLILLRQKQEALWLYHFAFALVVRLAKYPLVLGYKK